MNLRRHLLEAATLLVVAVAVALVSNSIASRERKLKLPGDYPNATTVPGGAAAPAPGTPEKVSPPSQTVSPESSPATVEHGTSGLSSKGDPPSRTATTAPPGSVGPPPGSSPSKRIPGGVSSAAPSAAPPSSPSSGSTTAELLARFPPHPDKPWVEISGEDAARLHAAGVPFLDARRTAIYADGHVAGARPFSVWESDVDEKVMALITEQDGKRPLVLYCSGGDCEDSHLLAQKLWGAGFNNNLVYRDGYPDWVRRGGAVRTGANP